MIAQQLVGLGTSVKQLAGQQLQSMGFQLNQMWAPADPTAKAYAIYDYDQARAHPSPLAGTSLPDQAKPAAPLPDSVDRAQETVEGYHQLFLKGLANSPDGANDKEQVDSLFKRLYHAVGPEGTDAEKGALKKNSQATSPLKAGK